MNITTGLDQLDALVARMAQDQEEHQQREEERQQRDEQYRQEQERHQEEYRREQEYLTLRAQIAEVLHQFAREEKGKALSVVTHAQ